MQLTCQPPAPRRWDRAIQATAVPSSVPTEANTKATVVSRALLKRLSSAMAQSLGVSLMPAQLFHSNVRLVHCNELEGCLTL